jgi:hypothetical protein
MGAITNELLAIARSGKFTAFLSGVEVTLFDGHRVLVRVKRSVRATRPVGLRFSQYSFVTEVSAGEFVGFGYGEAPTKMLAIQKSIAEGIERAIYQSSKSFVGAVSSNGWAAHLNVKLARQSATEELIERDAVLLHWLSSTPMKELSRESFPRWLQKWTNEELSLSPTFNRLRILISHLGFGPSVTTVIQSGDNFGVISHASSKTLESALEKALAETCRIAQIVAKRREKNPMSANDPTITPDDHAYHYAYREQIPTWLFGSPMSWAAANGYWREQHESLSEKPVSTHFEFIPIGPLVVGYSTSAMVQPLFFGTPESAKTRGLLNLDRILKFRTENELNFKPHFVP